MENNRIVLTSATIYTLNADDLDLIIFEQISKKKDLTHKNEHRIIHRMDAIEKAIVGTHILEAEVNNGGFNWFFFNYGEYFVQEAYDGFIPMGVKAHIELLEQALEIYNKEAEIFDKAFELRGKEGFKHLSAAKLFKHLDEKFYELNSLTKFRVDLIKQNKARFIET